LAKMANGSMRDGLSLLDRLISTGFQPLTLSLLEDFLGRPNAEKVQQLIAGIGDSDAAATLNATEALINSGLGEAQIVDALTEHFRDLLVIASAGANTDLLIMTADQKEKAVELAKKFDAAALIFAITTLEKLRWAVKNSDTPRALLDASLLRFALSEHFINVDELMARSSAGSPTPVKKKLPVAGSPTPAAVAAPREVPPIPIAEVPTRAAPMVGNVLEPWPQIVAALSERLGNGTVGLLSSAIAKAFEGDLLTLEFPAAHKMQKEMCESRVRAEQIATAVSEYLGEAVRIKFELAPPSAEEVARNRKPVSQRRAEILSDPGVKTVLVGLDATVTGIEET
ncbi:MAG: hypothetical protein JW993_12600, partial [Sedimentisphaerales bacterium]|nr:hypothetical protein [Sedimentisphaerales bacterium]